MIGGLSASYTLRCAGFAAALLLCACRPAAETEPAPPPPAPAPDRAQRFTWDPGRQVFLFQGQPLAVGRLWTFEGATDGFVLSGGLAELMEPAGLRIVQTASNPVLRSPDGLRLNGYRYSLVLVRLSRIRDGGGWDGSLLYRTAGHGESAAFQTTPLRGAQPQVGETVILAYDMARPKQGGDDWMLSYVEQLRLHLDRDPGGAFVIRQIAVVQNPGAEALGPAPKPKTILAPPPAA